MQYATQTYNKMTEFIGVTKIREIVKEKHKTAKARMIQIGLDFCLQRPFNDKAIEVYHLMAYT